MEKERKAFDIIKEREPEEEFETVAKKEGFDLKGKTKRVEVKYRKGEKPSPTSLEKTEYEAYLKYPDYWIYYVYGDLNDPSKVKIDPYDKKKLQEKNRIPDEPHTVVYRFYPNGKDKE